MEYMGISIAVGVIIAVSVVLYTKFKKREILSSDNLLPVRSTNVKEKDAFTKFHQEDKFIIPMELLPAESIDDETKLIEITDSKVLAHIDNLIPGLFQVANAVDNATQAARSANGEVLYRAVLPAGAKLSNSRNINGAVKEMYHGTNGIKGHADWVPVETQKGTRILPNVTTAAMSVASMVVGQYYMTQINAELGEISDGISQIQNFQNNEYRSRVFSLVALVKKIADFQIEILENDELRLSKIAQLDSLEKECTQLLAQANLTLAGFTKKNDLDYKAYEKALSNAQSWFIYQKSLLDVLYKISDLRYTLHMGSVSREQCVALLPIYTKQVRDTQKQLTAWHGETAQRLGIETEEIRRKRAGFDGVIHFIPGLFNDDWKFRSIEKKTAKMISTQVSGHESLHVVDTSELYEEDVQLISKGKKIYFLPKTKND